MCACVCAVEADDVRFSPDVGVYRVNERITCTARGYPTPSTRWQQVRRDGSVSSWVAGPLLTITDDMVGNNTWRCQATNMLGSADRTISFLVVGLCHVLYSVDLPSVLWRCCWSGNWRGTWPVDTCQQQDGHVIWRHLPHNSQILDFGRPNWA